MRAQRAGLRFVAINARLWWSESVVAEEALFERRPPQPRVIATGR
jgi:hypothetical protein